MKTFLKAFLLFLLFLPSFSMADDSADKKKALYFYSENSDLCYEVNDYFEENGIWDKFEIKKVEVSGPDNMNYLNEFFDSFGISPEKRGWPVIFFDREIIVGSQPIMDNFLNKMEKASAKEFPDPAKIKESFQAEKASQEEAYLNLKTKKKISPMFFLGAAIVDGISPCSFGVMIIFLSLTLLLRKNKRSLLLGAFFIFGVFVFHTLLGFSLASGKFDLISYSKVISVSGGIILILVGAFKMRKLFYRVDKFNFFTKKDERGHWFKIKNYLSKICAAYWVSLFLGFLSGYFLIPCSYSPYLSSVQNIYDGNQGSFVFYGVMILYNLIYVLPLILLMLLIFGGTKNKRIDAWETKHLRLINLIIGIIFLFVGVYLIQNWI